jgi:hypothetical protein
MAATAIGAGITSAAIGPITMDPKATLSPDRTQITLSGTINCFTGDIVQMPVNITETVGRLQRFGRGFSGTLVCTGAPQPWTAVVDDLSTLPWVAGPANANAFAFDLTDFTQAQLMTSVLVVP